MAFSPKSPQPDAIQPIDENVEFARFAAIRRSLITVRDDRQRQVDILLLRADLQHTSSAQTRSPRTEMLRDRLRKLEAAAPLPKVSPTDHDGLSPSLALAMRLVVGEAPEPEPDRAAALKHLRADLGTLERGLAEAERKLDAVRESQSLVVAEQLLRQHEEILRTMHTAATMLSAAADAERVLIASVIAAGYTPRPDILRRPLSKAAAVGGSLNQYDSDVSMFNRDLQSRGIV